MSTADRIRVGIAGNGVIGRDVAEAIQGQRDMALAGVADVAANECVAQVVKRRTR